MPPRARSTRRSSATDDENVARAVISLYMAEPFFAHIVQGLPRRIDETTPTAAVALVGGGIELRVNPAFFATLSRDERVAVIKHEVLHVVLKHLLRAEGRHARLWNLACDVVVNGLIGQWQLPEGAITRATFPDLDLPDDATAETVYAALRSPAAADNAALRDLLADEQTHMVGNHSDHSGWTGDNAPASPAAPAGAGPAHPAAAEAMVDGLLTRAADRMAADGWGSVPGAVRDALEEARQRGRPTVDWRRALRLFSASAGRTRLVTTNRRESTRYGSTTLLGNPSAPGVTTAGRLAPGTKIKRRYALLVAIDTSGSIGDEQLEAFFTEIHAIWRTGATIVVATCDAAVHDTFAYTGKKPAQLGGGGGTAFDPVFAWMREGHKRPFDGVVYLTDGEGPAPTVRPPCRLLWVVTGASGMGEHLKWGRQILLK
jgi:predicted metal-dependent peptidase